MNGLTAEELADYRARLESAADRLADLIDPMNTKSSTDARLMGKLAGFALALDYLRAYPDADSEVAA